MSRPLPVHLSHPELGARSRRFLQSGLLQPADLLFVDAVAPRYGEAEAEVMLGLALGLRAPRAGHVGTHLRQLPEVLDTERPRWRRVEEELDWPRPLSDWEDRVLASPMVGRPGDPPRPFVVQQLPGGERLLLTRRMWREQMRLATTLQRLAAAPPRHRLESEAVERVLGRLFAEPSSEGAQAVRVAAARGLTVVTGGPGTGKTYSIQRMLALLLELGGALDRSPRIALAAPTGKAAARMDQALAEGLEELAVPASVRDAMNGLGAQTLHRLLGVRPDGSSRHGPDRPLPADVVVVDEASMIDLVQMRRLVEAVDPGSRLVLLGDRDQLASVEAGTVLADVVGPVLDGRACGEDPLARAVLPFRTNHRFAAAPTISAIAAGLQRRDNAALDQVMALMCGRRQAPAEAMPDRVRHLGDPAEGEERLREQLEQLAAPYLGPQGIIGQLGARLRRDPEAAELRDPALHRRLLEALESYRVLAVHRQGRLGVQGLEQWLSHRCRRALGEAGAAGSGGSWRLPVWGDQWLGRPLLITDNSYDVDLMNGDVGMVLPAERGLAAVFPAGDGGVRRVPLARLPAHRGGLCMTVHKSQGSQFSRIAMVLAGRDSPIQTRELIYTAITRTRARLDWLGSPAELRRALHRRVRRASGLGALLWGGAQS